MEIPAYILNYIKNSGKGGTAPTGEIEITENGIVDVSAYATANVNVASEDNAYIDTTKSITSGKGVVELITKIGVLDLHSMTSLNSFFSNTKNLREVALFDTSNITNMGSMFGDCLYINNIPLFDTKNVTKMDSMFSYCQALTSVPQFNTAKVTTMRYMFGNCNHLVTIPILSTERVTNFQNMVVNCSQLSNDSLNNVLYMLANANVYTGTKTLAYIGVSSTQATTCTTLSNWQACVAAGWTTGY